MSDGSDGSDGIARFKDFTGDAEPITFRVGSEIFTAHDDIPLKHLAKLSELGEDLGETPGGTGNTVLKVLRMFERLLLPESYERFARAVNGESEVSIGVTRIKDIIPWLMEQYGLRPTEAPPSSSIILTESGASSTVGAAVEVSMSDISNPFVAST